ncbi:MAG: ATP-binding cassette domain-containing protein [Chloroflexi bacterium]|jgi:energy-coupling factor transport system ATP-binding protein|nr:ATP-binding cassette domain-containing protein [Chloroflexota bacterium]
MNEKIAVLNQVSYMYPRSKGLVLNEISMEIYKGEFLGLIGPTGAGKTTLCLTLNGIVPQFYGGRFFGHVTLAGLDTLEHPISTMAQHVGAVFEDPETQLTATSVENEIAFALENLKVPRDEILRRIPGVLEAVRLEGTRDKHPHELSGGQKQRLAIAAALALQPDVLILDEPTSQLDPVGSEEVFATVRELNRELGVTILMASHSAEEMAEYADRVIMLSHGELVASGAPDEIYSRIDYLHDHYLRPPQVSETFYQMQQFGVEVSEMPVRLSRGKELLQEMQAACTIEPELVAQLPPPPDPQGPPLLAVEDLHHTYDDGTHALQGVSLDIREGEYVLIIGQNGAGKSTLVKHFLKLLEPTGGVVRVSGADTRTLSVSGLARRIGYVAQNPDNQIFNATVEDEVAFALKNLGHDEEEVEARVTESLDAMGLLAERDRHPLSLPKGDRARVVIAAILAMKPEIIIFDEPTTGQDYRGAKYILEISKNLHERGKTVIVITHHLYLMPEYAERVVVMGKGTILLDAPIRQAYHDIDLLRATYLSPPQAVLLAQMLCGDVGRDGIPTGQQRYPLLTPKEVAACATGHPVTPAGGES